MFTDNLNFSRVPDNFIKKQKFNPDMSIIMSDDLYQDEEVMLIINMSVYNIYIYIYIYIYC